MIDTPTRASVPMSEVQPGKFFQSIVRPRLARTAPSALPFLVEFDHLHIVDARTVTHMVPRHEHRDYEIILVTRGDYRCLINDVAVSVQPGDALVLKPGDHHADTCGVGVAFMALVLRVTPGSRAGRSENVFRKELEPAQQVVRHIAGLQALVDRMRTESGLTDSFTAPVLDSLAQEFLWRLLRQMPPAHLSPDLRSGMEVHGFGAALLALFEIHVTRPLHPAEMAEALGMGERTLTSRCRAAFDTAPAKLFERFRLERARTLLTQTDLSVRAVAEHLGFVNQYHFSTAYKRVHGAPPTHHREIAFGGSIVA